MADKIYLKIEKDWQDNPREKLSYPIADKNGTVYRYGLSSALTYAKANNETEVVKKVKALYKKYGIREDIGMVDRKVIESVDEGFKINIKPYKGKLITDKKVFVSSDENTVGYTAYEREEFIGIVLMNYYNSEQSVLVCKEDFKDLIDSIKKFS